MQQVKVFLLWCMAGIFVFMGSAAAADSTVQGVNLALLDRGKQVYKKGNCAFCHGWAGDGRGHPRSPGVAASLRKSVLDKEALIHIIRCGVVGGVMPYHDRMAYRDDRCIGDPGSLDVASLPKKGSNISTKDLDALATYLINRVQGQTEVTFEQCEAFFKKGSRNCLYLQPETSN